MQHYTFGGYQAELNMDAARKWYAASDAWGCECGDCQNFLVLAQKKELPERIIEILDKLGIPPEKATYVSSLYKSDAGVLYQFSYRLAGTIASVPDHPEAEGQNWVRCCHDPYPYGAPNFPEPHFDLEFYETLPWVFDEAENG